MKRYLDFAWKKDSKPIAPNNEHTQSINYQTYEKGTFKSICIKKRIENLNIEEKRKKENLEDFNQIESESEWILFAVAWYCPDSSANATPNIKIFTEFGYKNN